MKSIDQIKLTHEERLKSSARQLILNKNLIPQQGNNNNFNKHGFNPKIRSNMLRTYYENSERINETPGEENNSDN